MAKRRSSSPRDRRPTIKQLSSWSSVNSRLAHQADLHHPRSYTGLNPFSAKLRASVNSYLRKKVPFDQSEMTRSLARGKALIARVNSAMSPGNAVHHAKDRLEERARQARAKRSIKRDEQGSLFKFNSAAEKAAVKRLKTLDVPGQEDAYNALFNRLSEQKQNIVAGRNDGSGRSWDPSRAENATASRSSNFDKPHPVLGYRMTGTPEEKARKKRRKKTASRHGGSGYRDDQPRDPKGTPTGGQWT